MRGAEVEAVVHVQGPRPRLCGRHAEAGVVRAEVGQLLSAMSKKETAY